MALYLGGNKVKINLDDVIYNLNLCSTITDVVRLLSLDGYALQDSTGLYLIPKDSEPLLTSLLLSSDGYVLTDADGLYIVFKESE